MANNLRLILDEIELVRESIQQGFYDSARWNPAYERLNALILKVCAVVPNYSVDVASVDVASVDVASVDVASVEPAELKAYRHEPTLASFLEVAERHKYQVTFTPTQSG